MSADRNYALEYRQRRQREMQVEEIVREIESRAVAVERLSKRREGAAA